METVVRGGISLDIFAEFLAQIENEGHRVRAKDVFSWVKTEFPDLEPRVAWNQPMFTNHGTFIIGFSIAKPHMAISPERQGMEHFSGAIAEAGYGQSKMLFRIRWEEAVNYELLNKIIRFNRLEKSDCKTFWRK